MTSFVVGKPAMFSPGAFGDRGIFKAISAVNENLYICGVMALSEEKIKAIKINCVINATLEWPPYKIPGLETIRVQVDDVPSSNLAPYFDKVADKMNEVISGGGRVLVHCMAGISRSSTLCIAYLMKHRGASLQQAYSLMKTKRPLIRPNDGFWRQLVQYEKELQRRKSKKSSSSSKDHQISELQLDRYHKPVAENPSITVTRLSSAMVNHPTQGQKVALHANSRRQRAEGRGGHPSLGYQRLSPVRAPSESASLVRNTSNHKLGTLRNSGSEANRHPPQHRHDLALSTRRSGDHWSTTYGRDYSK